MGEDILFTVAIICFLIGAFTMLVNGIMFMGRKTMLFRLLCVLAVGCFMVASVLISQSNIEIAVKISMVIVLTLAIYSITKIVDNTF